MSIVQTTRVHVSNLICKSCSSSHPHLSVFFTIAAQSLTGVSCPEEFDEEWGFMWNQTAANTIAGQRCQLLLDGPIVSGVLVCYPFFFY